jgi:hypothetical protein
MRIQFRSAAAWSFALIAVLGGALFIRHDGSSYGDDGPAVAADDESSRRLPIYYGRLALNDEQREEVYGIQAAYADQIDALLVQIEDLRTARDAEMETVLTPGQKLRLQELREEASRNAEAEAAAEAVGAPGSNP